MATVTALFIAGLALFFFGISGLREHLQLLAGRKFRRLLSRWTGNAALSAVWGVIFGAVTQSATAVSFILSALIANGSLALARALMVVGWANVGTVLLVFIASINLELGALYLIGVTGLMTTFGCLPKWKPVWKSLFAVGLLFLGLNLMKEAFRPLPDFEWFHLMAEWFQRSEVAAAILGVLLRTIIQSTSAIAVLVVTLAQFELLSPTQSALVIFGAAVGVGLASWLLSSELRGLPRQIVLFQGGVNAVSGGLCVLIVLLESFTGWPLLLVWLQGLPGGGPESLSHVFLFSMLLVAVLSTGLSPFAPAWLNRWSPPTLEQNLSVPQFIQDEALEDPEMALELAANEELALLKRFPAYLDGLREIRSSGSQWSGLDPNHSGFVNTTDQLEHFLRALTDQNLTPEASLELMRLQHRLDALRGVEATLWEWTSALAEIPADAQGNSVLDRLIEGADTVLAVTIDAWHCETMEDAELLLAITHDRGDMMEHIRNDRSMQEALPTIKARSAAVYVTSLFERLIWLLRQLGQSLKDGRKS